MLIQIISLFPESVASYFEVGMMRKAQELNKVEFKFINLRDFGLGERKTVDDIPYGGGDGMVLRPEPLFASIESCKKNEPEALVVLPTPRGNNWTQAEAQKIATKQKGIILLCARYEGYDERITELVDMQVSVGDYVLTCGELPAMTITDSVVRLLPGVLGGETSAEKESFNVEGKKEHPHYTRPADFNGRRVPQVLQEGNHQEIEKWREQNSIQ